MELWFCELNIFSMQDQIQLLDWHVAVLALPKKDPFVRIASVSLCLLITKYSECAAFINKYKMRYCSRYLYVIYSYYSYNQ